MKKTVLIILGFAVIGLIAACSWFESGDEADTDTTIMEEVTEEVVEEVPGEVTEEIADTLAEEADTTAMEAPEEEMAPEKSSE